MKLCFNHLLLAFSYALDCVERDCLKTTTFHGKRVTYMCLLLGEYFELDNEQLSDLVGCAIFHDNGLTEYYRYGDQTNDLEFLKTHCLAGEDHIRYIPFFHDVKNVILYHHERADGNGPFHRTSQDIPLYAKLIHITDYVDTHYDLEKISESRFQDIIDDLNQQKDQMFSHEIIDAFIKVISFEKMNVSRFHINEYLKDNIHNVYQEMTGSQLLTICQLFAKIIDSKSPHTRTHSIGVASKALYMAQYYHYNEDMMLTLFFAGAMHDVGKLVIDRDVLEKPKQLTDKEYTYMQTHAYFTYQILSDMDLGDIVHWSSYHHEKLDGTGYPFAKKADELDFIDRLMACCDIYQALREDRPYKECLNHEQSIKIMRNMVKDGKIDGQIVEDINIVFHEIS